MNKDLKPEAIWSTALWLSILLFVVAGVLVLLPKPAAASASRDKAAELRGLRDKVLHAKELYTELAASNAKLLWKEDAQTIGARSLAMVSRKARAYGLKLSAFRPQREVDAAGLRHLPFLILVEGTYPKVVGFVHSLEQPASKLAVSGVQIASTDGASDAVNATVNVVAFQTSKP